MKRKTNGRNADIRNYAKEKNVYLWEIAERLGIYDMQFSRMLRYEIPEEERSKIFRIIDDISAE